MSFWKIAWRNIEQRALASSLTALSMALGVAVMIAVLVIHSVAVRQFSQDAQGYHLIVGGKGGSLQLVLSTVYHLGQPLYPIPYTYYQKFVDGEFASVTEVAVPYCLGDSYQGPDGTLYRVIGTTPDLFDKIEYGSYSDGTPKTYEFVAPGRNFKSENFYEAVVGSIVAARAGLKLGDEVEPTHGISSDGHKHEGFKVVGILKPTGTANDRAVFINIEGFYLLEGHSLSPHDEHDEEAWLTEPGELIDAATTPATAGDHDHDHPADAAAEHEHDHPAPADAEHAHEHAEGDDHEHDHAASDHDHPAETGAEHNHDHAAGDHDHPADTHAQAAADADYDHAHDDHADHDHSHAHAHDHSHHDHAHEPLPIEQREVTSILVLCNSQLGPIALDTAINKGEDRIAQAVSPLLEITMLMDRIVYPIQVVLLVLTVLIIIVASISILVSIYNSMSERSHDIAVMRALGASRGAVMGIVLAESILLSVGGGLLGFLLGHGMIWLASPYVVARTGVMLGLFEFEWRELVLIPALVVLASLVGFLPALSAYRTDVAKSLAGSR